jgi:3-methyladenine DNA glycosylase AlkD
MPVRADLVAAIRSKLAEIADPSRAPGMQAYMKSSMSYRGVTSDPLRQACRAVFAEYPLASFDDWQDTVRALWHEADFREERYCALELIASSHYRRFRTLDALPLYQELIVSGAWWDLVDGLATHQIADLLLSDPEAMRPILLDWSVHEDHWLRRTSIICQSHFRSKTNRQLLYACIEPSLPERDFFLRKAIGWALREYAKAEPDAVRAYVAANAARLSTLSRREALKHLGS